MLRMNIDLGLIEGLCHSTGLSAEKLCGDRLAIFCRPGHALLKQSPLTLDQLNNERWILREAGSGTREIFTIATKGKLENLMVDLELSSSEAIKQAVKAGDALGCLSELAIAAELHSGELSELHIAELDLYRELYVLKRQNSEPSYLADVFLQRVLADVDNSSA
jgi:DNA-binding transcriptional LysR family regulator